MYNPKKDPALFAIFFTNVFSIISAYIFGWNLLEVLWVYWAQSVTIGVVNYHRMISLKEFSTDNLQSNGRAVPETRKAQLSTANFFAIHYGFFHVGYAVFLAGAIPQFTDSDFSFSSPDGAVVMMCILGFVATHIFSYRHNGKADFKDKKPNIGTLLFYPYMRIVPMHITIIFGFMFPVTAMLIFMVLKTFADIGMHIMEHRLFQKPD